MFLRWPGAITNGAPPAQLGGIDTAGFMMENTPTVVSDGKKKPKPGSFKVDSHITEEQRRSFAVKSCTSWL